MGGVVLCAVSCVAYVLIAIFLIWMMGLGFSLLVGLHQKYFYFSILVLEFVIFEGVPSFVVRHKKMISVITFIVIASVVLAEIAIR